MGKKAKANRGDAQSPKSSKKQKWTTTEVTFSDGGTMTSTVKHGQVYVYSGDAHVQQR